MIPVLKGMHPSQRVSLKKKTHLLNPLRSHLPCLPSLHRIHLMIASKATQRQNTNPRTLHQSNLQRKGHRQSRPHLPSPSHLPHGLVPESRLSQSGELVRSNLSEPNPGNSQAQLSHLPPSTKAKRTSPTPNPRLGLLSKLSSLRRKRLQRSTQ